MAARVHHELATVVDLQAHRRAERRTPSAVRVDSTPMPLFADLDWRPLQLALAG
jgi:hypothetical protein